MFHRETSSTDTFSNLCLSRLILSHINPHQAHGHSLSSLSPHRTTHFYPLSLIFERTSRTRPRQGQLPQQRRITRSHGGTGMGQWQLSAPSTAAQGVMEAAHRSGIGAPVDRHGAAVECSVNDSPRETWRQHGRAALELRVTGVELLYRGSSDKRHGAAVQGQWPSSALSATALGSHGGSTAEWRWSFGGRPWRRRRCGAAVVECSGRPCVRWGGEAQWHWWVIS
jgi:hypothetical protein